MTKYGCGTHTHCKPSNEIATSAGNSELCSQTGDAKRLLTFMDSSFSFALQEQRARAREGGLRIWTAHETECVLEVG